MMRSTNNAGALALAILTGTSTLEFFGGITATGVSTGTSSNGLAVNASCQVMLSACPGSASLVQIGALPSQALRTQTCYTTCWDAQNEPINSAMGTLATDVGDFS